nr:hypothetical protein KK1_026118 [Ipomoea batatas]
MKQGFTIIPTFKGNNRDALFMPEEVIRVNLRLHNNKPLKILLEILFTPNTSLEEAGVSAIVVHSEVQIPVIHISFSGGLGSISPHVIVQSPYPINVLFLLSFHLPRCQNSDEEIFVELIGGDFLPFVENLGGVLFQCSRDVENRHRGWDWYEVDFPGEENPEASAAAASDCPEKAVPSHHGPIRAAGYVPSDSQARTKPRRKTKNLAFLRDSVVHFSDRRPGLDPSAVIRNINFNSPELRQIDQDKRRRRFHLRRVGYPFVVMAAAADSELNAGFFSANDGGLDVGFIQRGEYEQRLGR